jgi:hypothetical protein
MLHVHPSFCERFAILVMRNMMWSGPKDLLSLQFFHVGYIKDSYCSKKPASVLPKEEQINVEYANINKKLCAAICESVHWTWWITVWTISAAHRNFLLVVSRKSSCFSLEHTYNFGEVNFKTTVYKCHLQNKIIRYQQVWIFQPQIYDTTSMFWERGYLQNKHQICKVDEKMVT